MLRSTGPAIRRAVMGAALAGGVYCCVVCVCVCVCVCVRVCICVCRESAPANQAPHGEVHAALAGRRSCGARAAWATR
jgi:hypothetical protein